MTDHFIKTLESAKKHIGELGTTPKNKQLILSFIDQLSAEGLTKVRQSKYLYAFTKVAELIPKDFHKINKQDILTYCSTINNAEYTEWTKRDFKIIIKRFVKWLREQEGQQFDKHQYPEEVKWVITTMKQNRIAYTKELLTFEDAIKLSEAANNFRDRAFVLFLYESGARIGEILSIRIKDVVFEQWGAIINMPQSKSKPRPIFVYKSATAISNWLMDHPDKNNKESFLFCGLWSKKRGEEINSQTFRFMLKYLAKKAGINKPVNPHNFRHSRATELADSLTNAQLCNYLGWQQGSRELSTYISMKDTKDAILKMNGIEKKDLETGKNKPITCPRCGTVNSPGSDFCFDCHLALKLEAIMNYEKTSKTALKQLENEGTLDNLLKYLQTLEAKITELEKDRYGDKKDKIR